MWICALGVFVESDECSEFLTFMHWTYVLFHKIDYAVCLYKFEIPRVRNVERM